MLLADGDEACDPSSTSYLIGKASEATLVGIGTFAVGAPGSEVARALLSQVAFNGGPAASATCVHDPSPASTGDCHLDTTFPAGSSCATLLQARLDHVLNAARCELEVPARVTDPAKVNVTWKEGSQPFSTVPRHDSLACSDPLNEGWQYTQGNSRIRLCTQACNILASHPQADFEIDIGCETVVK